MKNSSKTLFGLCMSVSQSDCREIYQMIKKEWFQDDETELKMYEVILSLITEGKDVNLLTVSECLMKSKQNSLVSYASQCLSDVSSFTFTNYQMLIEIIRYNYVLNGARKTSNELHLITSTEDVDFDQYVQALNVGLDQFQKEMIVSTTSTKDIIMNVLDRHDLAKKGDLGGILLGFESMKDDIVLEPVDVMVVGARPAMGKTSFGVAALCQLAFHEKRKVVYFNLEMSNSQLMRRIIANLTGIDSNKIKKGQCTEREMQMIYEVVNMPEMNNVVLYEGSHTIQKMKMKLTELKYSEKVEVFIVDYLQKVTAERGKTRYEQVTEASNGLKYISQNMKIPCIALAQLGRDAGRSGHRPILPDLRESGEIEQDASIVAFLHRPEYYGHETDESGRDLRGMAEFIIAKNREGENSILEFTVDLKTSRWIDNAPRPSSSNFEWNNPQPMF
jgi:replicative DNA helicase